MVQVSENGFTVKLKMVRETGFRYCALLKGDRLMALGKSPVSYDKAIEHCRDTFIYFNLLRYARARSSEDAAVEEANRIIKSI